MLEFNGANNIFCFVPPDGSPTGPTRLNYSQLQPSTLLEALLNQTGTQELAVAMFQIAVSRNTVSEPDPVLWDTGAAATEAGWGAGLLSIQRALRID